ncbi:hypothetical protein FF1_042527 [Malus domestica]
MAVKTQALTRLMGTSFAVPVVFIDGKLAGAMDKVMASHINGTTYREGCKPVEHMDVMAQHHLPMDLLNADGRSLIPWLKNLSYASFSASSSKLPNLYIHGGSISAPVTLPFSSPTARIPRIRIDWDDQCAPPGWARQQFPTSVLYHGNSITFSRCASSTSLSLEECGRKPFTEVVGVSVLVDEVPSSICFDSPKNNYSRQKSSGLSTHILSLKRIWGT